MFRNHNHNGYNADMEKWPSPPAKSCVFDTISAISPIRSAFPLSESGRTRHAYRNNSSIAFSISNSVLRTPYYIITLLLYCSQDLMITIFIIHDYDFINICIIILLYYYYSYHSYFHYYCCGRYHNYYYLIISMVINIMIILIIISIVAYREYAASIQTNWMIFAHFGKRAAKRCFPQFGDASTISVRRSVSTMPIHYHLT